MQQHELLVPERKKNGHLHATNRYAMGKIRIMEKIRINLVEGRSEVDGIILEGGGG